MRRSLTTLIVLVLLAVLVMPVGAKPSGSVDIQILGVNDFHGNIEPPTGSSGRVGSLTGTPASCVAPTCYLAGGAEYLAAHIKQLEATNPNTTVVSAGDLIGASPLLSALFHDEPTIEAFNQIGLDFNAVGNHEFDEGATELLRMQNGGCHPLDGCLDGDDFAGADFQFLAANVVRSNNKTLFPAYKIRSFGGAKVAFIGLTLEGTPLIVTPSGIAGLTFKDEADTINALVPELKAKGINTIVVLIHEGGLPTGAYNECPGISGPIVDIVNQTSKDVDLFITGHTHQAYNCLIDGRPVSSAFSFGRIVTDIDMTIDRASGEPTSIAVNNKIVTRDLTPDAGITALIAKYNAIAAPLANRVIGQITANITRTANSAGESALGDLIADAQLLATTPANLGGAVIAFMNPGGIRADLTYAGSPAGEGDGNVTYGESFTVQPFGNNLVTKTMTGAQIRSLLEQQFPGCNAPNSVRILQISAGFSYEQRLGAVACADKIGQISLNGLPIDPTASYRVTMNSFLADGGDGFSVFTQGTNALGGAVDTDALEAYFVANSPVAPGPVNRITVIP
jgi:5'-nucleotidase